MNIRLSLSVFFALALALSVGCGGKKDGEKPAAQADKTAKDSAKKPEANKKPAAAKPAAAKPAAAKPAAAKPAAAKPAAAKPAVAKPAATKPAATAGKAIDLGTQIDKLPANAEVVVGINISQFLTDENLKAFEPMLKGNPQAGLAMTMIKNANLQYMVGGGTEDKQAFLIRGGKTVLLMVETFLKTAQAQGAPTTPVVSNGNKFYTKGAETLAILTDGGIVFGKSAEAKALVEAYQGRTAQVKSNAGLKKLLGQVNTASTIVAAGKGQPNPMGIKHFAFSLDIATGIDMKAVLVAPATAKAEIDKGLAGAKMMAQTMTLDALKKQMGPMAMLNPELLNTGFKAFKELVASLAVTHDGTHLVITAKSATKLPIAKIIAEGAKMFLMAGAKLAAPPTNPAMVPAPATAKPAGPTTITATATAKTTGNACAKAESCCNKLAVHMPQVKNACAQFAKIKAIPTAASGCTKALEGFGKAFKATGKPVPAECQ